MDHPSTEETLKARHETQQPGEVINEHQIRGKLVELRPHDREYLCKAYHLSPDDLDSAVRSGISLLTTDAVSTDPTSSSMIEEIKRSLPPMGGSLKLTIGELSINKLGLYLDKTKVEALLEHPLGEYNQLAVQSDTGIQDETFAFVVGDEEQVLKLNTRLEYSPHTEPVCSIALLKDGAVEAIIPLETKSLDVQYEDGEKFSDIYVRGLDQSRAFSAEVMESLITDAQIAVEQARTGLGLGYDEGPRPHLILNASYAGGFGGRYMPSHRPQEDDGVILMSANRLLRFDDKAGPLERQRLLRHEYMHAVDEWLGEDGQTFSDKQKETFAMLINESLSGVRGLPESSEFDEEPLWYDKNLVGQVFTESYVLGDNLGHTSENIHELVASLLNNVVDARYYQHAFEGDIWQYRPLSVVERAKYMACHAKLMEIVRARIAEKLAGSEDIYL